MPISNQWFAVKTRSKQEKKIDRLLKQKGINSFLPLYSTLRYWSDRKKKVEMPLFSGYLFVKISTKERLDVLQTSGVVGFVSFEYSPVAIPDNQIESIKLLLNGDADFEVRHFFKTGQKVKIISGAFEGMEGFLVRSNTSKRLIISIEALNQSISIELDAHELEPA